MKIIRNKRGAELTMSTIIIAVLVVIVLIVLVLIFNKSARNFFLGTSGCLGKTGRTCESERCSTGQTNVFSGNPECESKYGTGYVCCETENSILGQETNP
jgi:hypothetical protein